MVRGQEVRKCELRMGESGMASESAGIMVVSQTIIIARCLRLLVCLAMAADRHVRTHMHADHPPSATRYTPSKPLCTESSLCLRLLNMPVGDVPTSGRIRVLPSESQSSRLTVRLYMYVCTGSAPEFAPRIKLATGSLPRVRLGGPTV